MQGVTNAGDVRLQPRLRARAEVHSYTLSAAPYECEGFHR